MKRQIMTVTLDAFLIINALPPPKFLQKTLPPTFSMVHLLHRLYGIDAPDHTVGGPKKSGDAGAHHLEWERG